MIAAKKDVAISAQGGEQLKVDIVVPGRFHAFALARGLLALGHDVVVHTNYPRHIVKGFGVPGANVRSFVSHGILSRICNRLESYLAKDKFEPMLHQSFGRWAARSVRHDADLIYGFSGVMEEILKSSRCRPRQLRALMRGSTHIREQARLLKVEETRVGTPLDRPSDWMIAREEREYQLADQIFVLSTSTHESFLSRGVAPARLKLNPLGVELSHFRATERDLVEREERLLTRAPLRVLTVGTFSYRKGARDIANVAAALSKQMDFRFVGDRPPETAELVDKTSQLIQFIDRVPEKMLMPHYIWADVLFFPTIEDGFPAVLLQAAAAGLPIIATANCSAPDLVVEGETGWVHQIRDTEGFIQRLFWCDENRETLAHMVRASAHADHARDWQVMAAELVSIYRQHIMTHEQGSPA